MNISAIKIGDKAYWRLILVIGFLSFFLILYRSIILSITYDEVWTYHLSSQSIYQICYAPENFSSANNHVLNSILIKPFIHLFGHKEWVLRLPNVLCFGFFYVGLVWLMQTLTKQNFIRLVGIIALCSLNYVLDFFSLSRGYGLALGFEMVSLAAIMHYFTYPSSRYLATSYLFASLAILSNFTWINFYVSLWFVMNIHWIFLEKGLKVGILDLIKLNWIPFLLAILMTILCFKPIAMLRTQDEFRWGANGWFDSFHTFAKNFAYSDTFWVAILLQALMLALVVWAGVLFYKNSIKQASVISGFSFLFMLLLTIVFVTIVQRNFFNIKYMDGRKAIMYYPIFLGLGVAMLDFYYKKNSELVLKLGASISVIFIVHFALVMRLDTVREWYFDAYTKEVCKEIYRQNNQAKVAMEKKYKSAADYYNHYVYGNSMQFFLLENEKANSTSNVDFYYISMDLDPKISAEFSRINTYGEDNFLFRKN